MIFWLLEGALHAPMAEIPARTDDLPTNQLLVVICHHGARSQMVVDFLAGGLSANRALNRASPLVGRRTRASSCADDFLLLESGVILAPDVGKVDRGWGEGELEPLHRVRHDLRNREVTKPLVVRRNDVPRRVFCTGRAHRVLERLFVEERRRLKIIPNGFGEKPVLKLMFGALIRAAERWRGLRFTEFELRQIGAVRKELDDEYQIFNHAAAPVSPAPSFQQIQTLTPTRRALRKCLAPRLEEMPDAECCAKRISEPIEGIAILVGALRDP